ncbi:MAG: hypothetical protein ACE5H3_12810, partial [Planctomycetota bacterium]
SLPPAFNRHWVPASVRAGFSVRREQPPPSEFEFWRGMKQRASRWALLGKALRAKTRPGESLVFRNIGAVGYYSGLRIFDQLGLTSREAALSGEGHALRVPGHDVQLPVSFFLKEEPTYLEARVRLKGEKKRENETRDKGLPAGYSRRTFSLDGLAGFPAGAALVVVRRDRASSGG